MHAAKLLHKTLSHFCTFMHQKRLNSLILCSQSLLASQVIQLTAIGRSIHSNARIKHKIKQADRLVSNPRLYAERVEIYKSISRLFITAGNRPVILIDWSDLTPNRSHFLLRASLAVSGRALTLYEEVHTSLDSRAVHQQFLKQLAYLLPTGTTPILVTDAGFRGTWFKMVEAMNWDWVGRVRGRILCAWPQNDHWFPCQELLAAATSRARHLGTGRIIRNHAIDCQLVTVKKPPKNRIAKTLKGHRQRRKHSEEHSRSGREAWLIATSLQGCSGNTIINYYALRMQIEESFRDVKNARYGLCLEYVGSRTVQRLTVLMILAHLVYTILFILGTTIETKNLHYQFQSNSTKTRRVLSVIYLALLAIRLQVNLGVQEQELGNTIKDLAGGIKERRF